MTLEYPDRLFAAQKPQEPASLVRVGRCRHGACRIDDWGVERRRNNEYRVDARDRLGVSRLTLLQKMKEYGVG